jgi:hypothetical protein
MALAEEIQTAFVALLPICLRFTARGSVGYQPLDIFLPLLNYREFESASSTSICGSFSLVTLRKTPRKSHRVRAA